MMTKDGRYRDVKLLFKEGKAQTFQDIFSIAIPKSIVAEDLRKEKGRFNELIEFPGDFKIKDIIRLGEFCEMRLHEFSVVLEAGYAKEENRSKDRRYEIVRLRFNDQQIHYFEDLFKDLPTTRIAEEIGKKGTRFNFLIDHVEGFLVKDMIALGRLFELPLAEILKLVEEQYKNQPKESNKS